MDNVTQQILLQIGVGVALSFLLARVYRALRPEPFLAYWSLYWFAFSAYLVVAIFYLKAGASGGPAQLRPLLGGLGYAVSFFQPVLMGLAGVALQWPQLSRRIVKRVLWATLAFGTAVGAFLYFSHYAAAVPPPISSARFFLHAASVAYFCWAFGKTGDHTQTTGGRLTLVFCGGYALHMLAHSVSLIGFKVYSGLTSNVASLFGSFLPLGMAIGVLLTVIEDARRASDEARESDRRFRAFLETLPLAVVMLDRDATVTFCNQTVLQMVGCNLDEMVGRNWHDSFVPERKRAESKANFAKAMQGGGPSSHENLVLTKTGKERQMQWTNTFLSDVNGRILSAFSVGSDITDQRQMEDNYRQAQKMESVGRLAGGVAHDFNNHLTVINGYCDMILKQLPEGDRVRKRIQQVRVAGDRAADLTKQLLAFSRKQVLSPKALSWNAVVKGMESMLSRLVREQILLKTDLSPDAGTVLADPSQMEQVLMNLVVNASDSIHGAGSVRIETANVTLDAAQAANDREAQPGDYVMLAVSDTGGGIDAETRDHIFEPFFTTKELGKGTGLGLSMVYGIVKQSGGWVSVESQLGKGSTFRIYLPRERQMPVEVLEPREISWRGGEAMILVVEDQDQVRLLVVDALRGAGYEVAEARNGAEGLAQLAQVSRPIDLLVTDVVMPQMSGPDLALRMAELRPETKVLYISGYAAGAFERHGISNGNQAYLSKPFTATELLLRVDELLR